MNNLLLFPTKIKKPIKNKKMIKKSKNIIVLPITKVKKLSKTSLKLKQSINLIDQLEQIPVDHSFLMILKCSRVFSSIKPRFLSSFEKIAYYQYSNTLNNYCIKFEKYQRLSKFQLIKN